MKRVHAAVVATLISTTMFAGAVGAAQAPPQLQPVLAGKKITPPLKGEATVEYMQPVTKPLAGQNKVETVIKVRNVSPAPIARLQVSETWYDGAGAIVAGGKGTINGLLQPGEVGTITIDTPYSAKMKSNNWNFTHANGTVKPAKVKSLDDPNAAKNAPAGGAKGAPGTTAKK